MDSNTFHTMRGYQTINHAATPLTPSLEDYLEMIYRNILSDGIVRVKTLSQRLNVKPPSVSRMMAKLNQMGYLDYEKYGLIRLTPKGEEMGKYLLARHDIIYRFFSLLNGNEASSVLSEAEQVEHTLSRQTVAQLERLIRFMEENPDILDKFQNYRSTKE